MFRVSHRLIVECDTLAEYEEAKLRLQANRTSVLLNLSEDPNTLTLTAEMVMQEGTFQL